MGWGNCGEDSKGRPIGYSFEATCDHPGCKNKIDRGLSYACGQMHGYNGGYDCDGYFCGEHCQNYVDLLDGEMLMVCDGCRARLLSLGDFVEDKEEGSIREIPGS